MPVPIPRSNEEKDAYISRCIKRLHDIDSDRPNDQIIAMCYSIWRKHRGGIPPATAAGKLAHTLARGKK